MTKIYFRIGLLFLLALATLNCKSSKNETPKKSEKSSIDHLSFLDKEAAKKQIIQDVTDGFFESITLTDISIQLKKADLPDSKENAKMMYLEFLQSEMEDFTSQEKAFLTEVFDSARSILDKINPKLFPEHIELIKTKTNHYGPNVYYTREDAIILPDNIFEEPSVEAQMPVMLHEIFHILSRYNKTFREQMYALIGFVPFKEKLILPRGVADRVLTNPDGVRRDYAIRLKDQKGIEQLGIPLISSTKDRYQSSIPTFFGYLSFDLYPLIKMTDSQVTIGLDKEGKSALSNEHNADFFTQIKDNTVYIIHPDEIMADNFMMAAIANNKNDFNNFSEEGRKLLKDVLEILKTFE